MASLLNLDPEVLALLSGNAQGGLLTGKLPGAQGLLGGGFTPKPNEGFLDSLLGTNDPRDPRGPAMAALAQGLLRGKFADGLAGANRAFYETEDRNLRRQSNSLAMTKDVLSLNDMVRKQREDAEGRDVLQEYYSKRGAVGAPGAMPGGMPGGDPSMGGAGGGMNAGGAMGAPAGGPMGGPAPATGGQQGGGLDMYSQYRLLGDAFAAKGLGARAQSYYELAEKHRPKYSQTPQLMKDPVTGKLVQVLISDDGSTKTLPFGAKPDISLENLGGKTVAIDKNAVADGKVFERTMTPGEIASDRLGRGNLSVAQQRLALEANSPQYMQTEGGLVALPKRPTPGAPLVGQPVTGPNGEQFGPPLKQIPASANTAIMTNMQNLNRAKQALALVQGGKVGQAQGDTEATGIKGYLPNGVLARVDGSGVDTRAAIADLGSLVIHDRSGAAVTAAESPRLMPFIPLATDNAATVEKKLKRFMDVYQQETDALAQTYSKEQGYRENPILKRTAGNNNETLPGALPLPPKPTASSLKRGQTYQLPNGVEAVWDGLQFKTGAK